MAIRSKIDWFKSKLKVVRKHKDFPFFVAGLSVLLFFAVKKSWGSPSENAKNSMHSESVDTYIPEGFVLIPIEVANLSHLNQIMGAQAVVDLYTLSLDGQRSKKPFASKVKVVRAPQNENVLAVLSPEDRAGDILSQPGPFYVALQNPKNSVVGHFENKTHKKAQGRTSRIIPTSI